MYGHVWQNFSCDVRMCRTLMIVYGRAIPDNSDRTLSLLNITPHRVLCTKEEEEVALRIEKVIKKKSVSIVDPTPILPALCTLIKELGVQSLGKVRVGYPIDMDFFSIRRETSSSSSSFVPKLCVTPRRRSYRARRVKLHLSSTSFSSVVYQTKARSTLYIILSAGQKWENIDSCMVTMRYRI